MTGLHTLVVARVGHETPTTNAAGQPLGGGSYHWPGFSVVLSAESDDG